MISPGYLFISDIFIFQDVKGRGGVKGQKVSKDDKTLLSDELHISGTIHHIIFINGKHVFKDS